MYMPTVQMNLKSSLVEILVGIELNDDCSVILTYFLLAWLSGC